MDIARKTTTTVDLRKGPSRQEIMRQRFEAQRMHHMHTAYRTDVGLHSFTVTETITKDRVSTTSKTGKWWTTYRNIIGGIIVCGVMVGLFVFTSLTSIDIFFWIFFVAMLLWRFDSRIAIGGALMCLIAIPILLVAHRNFGYVEGEVWSEKVAVWAYYFLVIGVVGQIVEYISLKKNDHANELG